MTKNFFDKITENFKEIINNMFADKKFLLLVFIDRVAKDAALASSVTSSTGITFIEEPVFPNVILEVGIFINFSPHGTNC